MATTTAQIFVNGVSVMAGGGTISNGTIDFTRGDWFVGSTQVPGQWWNGCISDLWFDNSFVDSSANIGKFITPADQAVHLVIRTSS